MDLATEFCLCDCPMLLAPQPHEHPEAVLRLVSRCITEAFRWSGTLPVPEVLRRLSPPSAAIGGREEEEEARHRSMMVAACCHCPRNRAAELEAAVRDPSRHSVWVPPLLEIVGVALDIDGLLLQVAFLMSPAAPLVPVLPPAPPPTASPDDQTEYLQRCFVVSP